MFLTTDSPLASTPAREPKGATHLWEIFVIKSEAITLNEAVFDWDKYPGSFNGTSAGWLHFRIPRCDLAKETLPFWSGRVQNAAAVEIRLWALRPPRAHLGSCSMFTSMGILGACSYSLKGQSGKWKPLWDVCVVGANLTRGTQSGSEGQGIPECSLVRFPCNSQGVCKENRLSNKFLILSPSRLLPNSQSLPDTAAVYLPLLQTCIASC